ncbi:hypothetical protein [Natrinema caseinilyticum]|uniref:hypothetical protein n=1 Tax=Natrinema caseinilyticum TaxID=2961570 RepID=UPI0020C3FC42|nr:hypothetical protein [Natrinema caseinilyticum]
MPETDQQDKTLSELIVKEAVNQGMDSPMRDSILEAVEEADGSKSGGRIPLAGALVGLGAAVGFLAGRQSHEFEGTPIEEVEEPDIIEDVRESAEEAASSTATPDEVEVEVESESRRLPKLLLVVGVLAGAAFLRRRLSGGEEEEWEPIEEFEPATGGETEEERAEPTEESVEESEETEGEKLEDETEE